MKRKRSKIDPVLREILADGRTPRAVDPWHGDPILLWQWISARVRGDDGLQRHELTPVETQRARHMLEIVRDALEAAAAEVGR